VPKFRRATPFNSEVISAKLLHFKPIFDPPLKKVVRGGGPSPFGGALVRLGDSLARVKIWKRSTPYGLIIYFDMVFRIMHFRWARFNIEISKVTGPNFTGLVSPNAKGIAVDGIKIRF